MPSIDIKTRFLGFTLHTQTVEPGQQVLHLKKVIISGDERGDILFKKPVITPTNTGIQIGGASLPVEKGTVKPISSQRVESFHVPESQLTTVTIRTRGILGVRKEITSTSPEKTMRRQIRKINDFFQV